MSRRYATMSKQELLAEIEKIGDDPTSKAPPGELFTLNQAARKKLDTLREWVTYRMQEERAAAGRPVPTAGYSGRQSKKRR